MYCNLSNVTSCRQDKTQSSLNTIAPNRFVFFSNVMVIKTMLGRLFCNHWFIFCCGVNWQQKKSFWDTPYLYYYSVLFDLLG